MLKEAEPFRFSQRSLELLNQIAVRVQPDDPALNNWYSNYCKQHQKRLAADLRIIELHVPNKARILEYGAIPLLLTGTLAALEYDVSALDVAPERFANAIADLRLHVIRCDVESESVPFPEDSFDAVIFNELFEHLRINPILTLREAYRVLKPDGLLLLSTPNLRSFRGIRNLLLHNQGHAVSSDVYLQYQKLETLGHMGHVREYTTKEVSEFLSHIGFTVDKIIFRGGYGKGLVGVAERLAPGLRPFFSLIARKGN